MAARIPQYMEQIVLKARQFFRAVDTARCVDDLHQLTCPHCGYRYPNSWIVGEGSMLLISCPCCLARVAFGIKHDRLAARVVSAPLESPEKVRAVDTSKNHL